MRAEVRNIQRNLYKIVFTIVAMELFNVLLWLITEPICSLCESAGIGRGIGGTGWIVSEATRVIAIFIVSFLSGVLFPRERWIARLAATLWLLWLLFSGTTFMLHLSSVADGHIVSFFFRSLMIPLLCVTVIVLLFSPFFHDFGRLLRSYIQNRAKGVMP